MYILFVGKKEEHLQRIREATLLCCPMLETLAKELKPTLGQELMPPELSKFSS